MGRKIINLKQFLKFMTISAIKFTVNGLRLIYFTINFATIGHNYLNLIETWVILQQFYYWLLMWSATSNINIIVLYNTTVKYNYIYIGS